jgi:hypothetical protein
MHGLDLGQYLIGIARAILTSILRRSVTMSAYEGIYLAAVIAAFFIFGTTLYSVSQGDERMALVAAE